MTKRQQRRPASCRGLLAAVAAALGATVLAVGAVPVGAADNDQEPAPGDDSGGGCTDKQKEGGYEEIDGRCQLTGWNWDLGYQCGFDVDIGSLGDRGPCEPSGGGGGSGLPGGDGPGQPGDAPWPSNGFGSWEAFAGWCHANGGVISGWDPGDGSIRFDTCQVDGVGIGQCWGEADLEDPAACVALNGLPDQPPNSFPAPTTTAPGSLERPTGALDEVAGPLDDPAEPTGPAGPVVTIEAGTGVVLSDVTAGAGGAGSDEPEPPVVTVPGSELSVLDVIIGSASGAEAGPEPGPAAAPTPTAGASDEG